MVKYLWQWYWLTLTVALTVVGCQPIEPKSPSTTSIETKEIPVSQVESYTAPVTELESQQVSSTTTSVDRIISDLNSQKSSDGTAVEAKKVSSGIQVNLPDNILFDFDKAEIRPEAKATLTKLNQLIASYKQAPVEIYGHTDSKGNDAYNQSLSEKRAKAVQEYLVKNFKVETSRLSAKGLGEKKPVAPNTKSNGADNPEGRQKNRRVEILIRNGQT
jgi:outer membrane protein OmpA-like peptidoglycan-associated protein